MDRVKEDIHTIIKPYTQDVKKLNVNFDLK